jgi:hypothetical protein
MRKENCIIYNYTENQQRQLLTKMLKKTKNAIKDY